MSKHEGTHAALERFGQFSRQVSRNHTRTGWVLKCDIRKFFASIDQTVLLRILEDDIPDVEVMALLKQIITSFETSPDKGLPLGNLTSQLLVNVYMNELDQFVKRHLKARYYIRYADDFIFFSSDRDWLLMQLPLIEDFLRERLGLILNPQKTVIQTLASGVDFLGWVHFPHHRVLRTKTKQRMSASVDNLADTLQSNRIWACLVMVCFELGQEVLNKAWLIRMS